MGKFMGDQHKEELEHLDQIKGKLTDAIDDLNKTLGDMQSEIVKMKKYFWENTSEFDEFGYEQYTNREMIQSELNSAEERLHKRQLYEKMLLSPYFARIDFCYEGEARPDAFYIGIASFLPKKSYLPLIFDWRAPVSGLYYDFDRGPAAYKSPQGEMRGEITRKMQYKITNGEMEYFFENDIKIDDDILQRELGKNANAHLKNIVATIQKEQNAIIRNESDRILVVQGSAGSGKTSIALHRIAYLLYHKRNELRADNVMILSPNTIFSDYISHILPELGEEHILEMSFDDFAERELKGIVKFEDRYSQLEYLLEADLDSVYRNKKMKAIRRKQSKEYLQEMYGFILDMESDFVEWKDFQHKKVERSKEQLMTLFYEKFPDVPLLSRLEAIAEYIVQEEEALHNQDMDEGQAYVIKEKISTMYKTQDIRKIYHQFLLEKEEDTFDYNDEMIPYEDVYPLIYFKYMLKGVSAYRRIKHLVIDEMQDYTRVQYEIIKQLFDCPMTILGDKEQVADDKSSLILSDLSEVFGRNMKQIIMKKSYRSTYEIGSMTGRMIQTKDIEYFERHGRAPVIHELSSKEEQYSLLVKEITKQSAYGTIAILCLSQKEAATVYESIKDEMNVTLMTEESDTFTEGVVVTSFYLAKGLEFDAVHIPNVEKDRYFNALHRQILYISCTRALHELDIYAAGEVSDIIVKALPSEV